MSPHVKRGPSSLEVGIGFLVLVFLGWMWIGAPNTMQEWNYWLNTSPAERDSQKAVQAGLLGQIAESHTLQDILVQKLDGKFAAIDLESVLTPASLTTANGISRAKATIQQLSELIEERRRLVDGFYFEGERTLRNSELNQENLQVELETFYATKKHMLNLFADVENAQRRSIGAVMEIVNLCEKNLGQLSVRDGYILFPSQEQLNVYETQLALGQKYAQEETRAMAAFIAFAQQVRPTPIN